jgi:hypothetical protein
VEALVAALRAEFPGLHFVDKAHDPVSRLIDLALRAVTLGGQSGYLDRYVTTLGRTIYLPSGFSARDEDERYCVLRHEAVHLRQFARYGYVGMTVRYLVPLLPPGLPLGFALGRARLEWEAYAETLRAIAEVRGPEALCEPGLRAEIVRQFTGPAYGWMWPFPSVVRRWYDREVARILDAARATSGPPAAVAPTAVPASTVDAPAREGRS